MAEAAGAADGEPPLLPPPLVIAMGVAGSGKSTFGSLLARRLRCPFLEGDDLHPPANRAKMAAGHPLDDADRAPWLAAIAAWLGARRACGKAGVAACSALKRAYRDRLRRAGATAFILLDAPPAILASRLRARRGHFMSPALLASQLATLEPPGPDEDVLVLDAGQPPAALVAAAAAWLAAAPRGSRGRPG